MKDLSLDHIPLKQWRWIVPIPACCLLQALFGLLYANGVFIALLDIPQYTVAIGVAGFFTAIGITVFGIMMNKFIPRGHYERAPFYISILGSIGLSSQLLMAYALQIQSNFLLFLCAIFLGIGSGCLYVASIDVLQTWVPESPGLVTGIGMLFGGAGSLGGIYLYGILSNAVGSPIRAMALSGIFAGILSLCGSMFIKRAPRDWKPKKEMLPLIIAPEDMLAYSVYPSLTVYDILSDSSFYVLIVAFAATVGPGFGFVLGFQAMCSGMFEIDVYEANRLFVWVTLSGIVGRLVAGVAIDGLEDRSTGQHGLQGARKTNCILLIAQAIAIVVIPFAIRSQAIVLFTVASSVVYITFSGGAVVSACLVRGIFMPNNGSLAFSLVAIGIGVGDMFFSWVIARCGEYAILQRAIHDNLPVFHQNDYNLFWLFSLLWSLIGLVATAMIKPSRKVSMEETGSYSPLQCVHAESRGLGDASRLPSYSA